MTNKIGCGIDRRELMAAGAGAAVVAAGVAGSDAQAQGAAPIIDFHNHFVGKRFEMTATGNSSGPAAELLRKNMSDEGALIGSVDEAKIAARVINTPTAFIEDKDGNVPAGTHQKINDSLAELVAKHKGKIHAMATVDAYAGESSAKELERASKLLGLKGVFIESGKRGLLPDAPEARPTMAVAEQLGIPIFLHPVTDPQMHERFKRTGRNGVRLARATINSAAIIAMLEGGVFEKHPKLNVVVTTLAIGGVLMAGGFGDGARIRADTPAAQRRHVYIDTMGLHPALVRSVVDLLGPDHVLMGTDWPIVVEKNVPERWQKAMDACGLDAAQQKLVSGGNAMRLLGIS
jgi:aminocarboxymuconate-semialdehyde decarboxylase